MKRQSKKATARAEGKSRATSSQPTKAKAKSKAKAKAPQRSSSRASGKSAAKPRKSPIRSAKATASSRKSKDASPNNPIELSIASEETSELEVLESPPKRRPSAMRGRLTRKRADILLNLEEALGDRIVGKREAIAAIARVVRVRLAKLDFRPERPDGSFLIVGPTGVGKNEFAYALSEILNGSEERVISIDLGEIDDEEDLAKLGVTLVPGTEDQILDGMLTSPVREDPEAIILLRGLENAHLSFQRLLINILERGKIDDMLGTVDFCRSIIMVTTHVSKEETAPKEIGFTRETKTSEELTRLTLEGFILPDLLDAFNEIVDLPPLTTTEVRQIAKYKVGKVIARMQRRQKEIRVSDTVYDELISEDFCGEQGAKFLNRTLEKRLFNPLARYMLSNRANRNIRVQVDDGKIVIDEGNSR